MIGHTLNLTQCSSDSELPLACCAQGVEQGVGQGVGQDVGQGVGVGLDDGDQAVSRLGFRVSRLGFPVRHSGLGMRDWDEG